MRVPAFTVRDQRSIKLALCENVPPLMVVAGPNGAGKSTLLNAIRQQFGNVMYVGPHRAMRRQKVQQRHLHSNIISFENIMMGASVPSYEGIRMVEGNRDAWGYDDSANYLKHALCQIEVSRSEAITACYVLASRTTEPSLGPLGQEPAFTPFEQATAAARVPAARADQETGWLTLERDGWKLRMAHGRYCSRAVRRRAGGSYPPPI